MRRNAAAPAPIQPPAGPGGPSGPSGPGGTPGAPAGPSGPGGGTSASNGSGGSGLINGASALAIALLFFLRLANRAGSRPVWRAYLPEVPPA